MKPLERLRSLPLRGKVILTVLGAAIAVLGASTYLSFRYWRGETLAAAEQQALLAAGSLRTTLESALRLGQSDAARGALARLRDQRTITGARVFDDDRTVTLSADRFEEGRRIAAIWIPDARALPEDGVVNAGKNAATVRAYVPLSVPAPAVLEVEFSVDAIRAAMDRGARLGIGLMAFSLVAVGLIVVTMFEREVVAPLHRMDILLRADQPAGRRAPTDELREIERSVTRLLEKGHEAEARVANQAGLAQIGELAAEMAHEFKRPLASIRTAVDVLQQEYSLDNGGRAVLEALDGQLDRLSETMHDLFSLAKPIVPEARPVDLAETLDAALLELASLPSLERVAVRRLYAGRFVEVPGDARRIRQVFMNILANAAEAMPSGGTITVELDSDGSAAQISITDTGGGLAPEEVQRVLKPFYSTKPLGTGLGLPLVARVVAAHNGGLAIESLPGRGTTVRVCLPLAPRLSAQEA